MAPAEKAASAMYLFPAGAVLPEFGYVIMLFTMLFVDHGTFSLYLLCTTVLYVQILRAIIMPDQNDDISRLSNMLDMLEMLLKQLREIVQALSDGMPFATGPATITKSIHRATHVNSLIPEDIAERAGRLVDRYQELYTQYRRGAKTRIRPTLDWDEACGLVRLWDNARLDKLAVLVLTTDDEWISRTDRNFTVFAAKAGWADDRLRAWEIEQEKKP